MKTVNFSIELANVLDGLKSFDELSKMADYNKSHFLDKMREVKISDLNRKQIKNLVKFISTCPVDSIESYIGHIFDNEYELASDSDENMKVEKCLGLILNIMKKKGFNVEKFSEV